MDHQCTTHIYRCFKPGAFVLAGDDDSIGISSCQFPFWNEGGWVPLWKFWTQVQHRNFSTGSWFYNYDFCIISRSPGHFIIFVFFWMIYIKLLTNSKTVVHPFVALMWQCCWMCCKVMSILSDLSKNKPPTSLERSGWLWLLSNGGHWGCWDLWRAGRIPWGFRVSWNYCVFCLTKMLCGEKMWKM